MSEKYVKLEKSLVFDEEEKNEILNNYYTLRNNIYTWEDPNSNYYHSWLHRYFKHIRECTLNDTYVVSIEVYKITKNKNNKYYKIHSYDDVFLREHFKDDLDIGLRIFYIELNDDLLKLMNEIMESKESVSLHLTYYYKTTKLGKKEKFIKSFDREDMVEIKSEIREENVCCCIIL